MWPKVDGCEGIKVYQDDDDDDDDDDDVCGAGCITHGDYHDEGQT